MCLKTISNARIENVGKDEPCMVSNMYVDRGSGPLRRQSLFITTKVNNKDQGYAATRAAVTESLRRLGVNFVDLLLVHSPCCTQARINM